MSHSQRILSSPKAPMSRVCQTPARIQFAAQSELINGGVSLPSLGALWVTTDLNAALNMLVQHNVPHYGTLNIKSSDEV